MKKNIFRAAPGACFSHEKAQIYGDELAVIMKKHGRSFSPHEIVKEAEKESSPLHDAFEWDDSKAGYSWRISQAQNMTNHIKVVLKRGDEEIEQKAFFSVRIKTNGDEERRYASIDVVVADKDLRDQVVADALRELIGWEKRYKEYSELSDIFAAIEKTQRTLKFKKKVLPNERLRIRP